MIGNGVDLAYFDPSLDLPTPFATDGSPIVFTGAMDYWANAEAVIWFASEVLPRLRKRHSSATFYIVGSNPIPAVRALARLDGVRVTGTVPDVRPYLRHAHAVAAPLRVARGIQNKILEALAMATQIVTTPQALVGLSDYLPVPGLRVANDADSFAAELASTLDLRAREQNRAGRDFVQRHFAWEDKIHALLDLLDLAEVSGTTVAAGT